MVPGISTGWPTVASSAGTSGWCGGSERVAPFAVHAQGACLAVDGMGFDLGEVVRHVVEQVQRCRGFLLEHPPCRLGEQLAVGASVVGRRGHRGQVGLALGRADGHARQLAVRHLNAVAAHGVSHLVDVIGADLVAQAARAGVDHDAHGAFRESHLWAAAVS